MIRVVPNGMVFAGEASMSQVIMRAPMLTTGILFIQPPRFRFSLAYRYFDDINVRLTYYSSTFSCFGGNFVDKTPKIVFKSRQGLYVTHIYYKIVPTLPKYLIK